MLVLPEMDKSVKLKTVLLVILAGENAPLFSLIVDSVALFEGQLVKQNDDSNRRFSYLLLKAFLGRYFF